MEIVRPLQAFRRGRIELGLVVDKIHRYMAQHGECRIRIYRREDGTPVVIATQRAGFGVSITTAAESIATEIWESLKRPDLFIWIEHYPTLHSLRSTILETFDRVWFSVSDTGTLEKPAWRRIPRDRVERLIGQTLEDGE